MDASSAVQQQALNLLYGTSGGAGLTILRNEISADSGDTIEPNAPSSPSATPTYLPLSSIGEDQGQLWFAQQIKAGYGVTNVFADAWCAPAFMKTNDATDNGGAVCGMSGATCRSGNWVQAYANYLKQYAADYSAAGDPLTYIGPENEANLSTSYDSMQMTPAQTAQPPRRARPDHGGSGLPRGGMLRHRRLGLRTAVRRRDRGGPDRERRHGGVHRRTGIPRRPPPRCPAGPSPPGRPSGPRSTTGIRPGTTAPTPRASPGRSTSSPGWTPRT